jgi:hypothetical protein
MVENLAESLGMCSDGPGRAPIEIPKRETFSLRGSKKEREGRTGFGGGKGKGADSISSRGLGPTRARHGRTVRDTTTDSPRGARTVRTPAADCPLMLPEQLVLHLLPTIRADGPRCPSGQSARTSRTVRRITADGPTSSFNFSVK